ncbi:unnamed protein product [Parnassius apollo]|uniref:(apollo) hypothetical protein n=1 Tax=Parnassius apollo TaxID=110799 RepID=A0A8S3XL48_PARAO|nr:unnamed protein product [Parnassius apollo]
MSIIDSRWRPWVIFSKVGDSPVLQTTNPLPYTRSTTSPPLALATGLPQMGCQPLKSPPICVSLSRVADSSLSGSMYTDAMYITRFPAERRATQRLGVEYCVSPIMEPHPGLTRMQALTLASDDGNFITWTP